MGGSKKLCKHRKTAFYSVACFSRDWYIVCLRRYVSFQNKSLDNSMSSLKAMTNQWQNHMKNDLRVNLFFKREFSNSRSFLFKIVQAHPREMRFEFRVTGKILSKYKQRPRRFALKQKRNNIGTTCLLFGLYIRKSFARTSFLVLCLKKYYIL